MLLLSALLPTDHWGRVCGIFEPSYIWIVFGIGLVLSFILSTVELIVRKVRKNLLPDQKKRLLLTSFASVVIAFFLLFLLLSLGSGSGDRRNAKIMSDLRQLRLGQKLHYVSNGHYASTQQELVDAGLLGEELRNPRTKELYTDRDGNGIEGGDDNPETWSVSSFLPQREYSGFCQLLHEGVWFTCNQKDCFFKDNLP